MQAPQQALKLSLSESFPGPTIDQVRQLAPIPDDQISIWKDPKKVAHVGFHGPGRHATTLELAQGCQSWWPDSHDDSEYDRDVKNIWYSTLRWHMGEILSRDIKRPIVKAGKRPEKELFPEPELQTMLLKMGKTVRRVVVMGLGTLEKAKQEDFPHNYRSYMLVRQIIGSLLEMLRKEYIKDWSEKPHVEVIFEDDWYTDFDIEFLSKEFFVLPDVRNEVSVSVRASNNGSWLDAIVPTDGRGGWMGDDWMFITFNTKTPVRQVLAGHVCGPEPPESPNPIQGKRKKPMKPSAIICRPWGDQDPESCDSSDERVKKFFQGYNQIELLKDDPKGLGHSVFHYLEPREVGKFDEER